MMEMELKIQPGPGIRNLITDIAGVQVGHAQDESIGTGVTVLTGVNPFSAAVDVRGGGPGTRETDMLSLENSVGRADAIVLSGGSAYGLDASSEIQDLLRQDGKGYQLGKAIIPLVPSAVIFDLNIHDNPHVNSIGKQSPWRKLANKAYASLSSDFKLGSYGAGCGATTATVKGGQGSSSWKQKYSNNEVYFYSLGFYSFSCRMCPQLRRDTHGGEPVYAVQSGSFIPRQYAKTSAGGA